jgi:UDP-N-acetylglucosamine diphosphorylase/glucosamine-1-phosphate N-acetyltransferase
MKKIQQAVILAAGEGQRLRPFTARKPKALIQIANKPIIQYVIEALAQNGIRRIVIVVGYMKEQIQDYLASGTDFGVEIEYVIQSQQLGTGHALRQVKQHVDDTFIVVPGDNIIAADTIATFVQLSPNAILVKELPNVTKYGKVIAKKGLVKDIVGKPEETETNLVNIGTYLLTREIFNFLNEELKITSALKNMMAAGQKITAHKTDGIWLDVVYPWDILRLNEIALQSISSNKAGTIERGATIKGPVSIGKNTTIKANCYIVGPVIIGENCEIGPSTFITPTTSIGSNTTISPFTEIRNSVIGDNVNIGSNSIIEDSVINKGCTIKGRFTARSDNAEIKIDNEHHKVKVGAMISEYCSISDGVTIYPGIFIGNKAQIKELKLIRDNVPDGAIVV